MEYERIREDALLTDEELNTELIKYANEICESNPIRYWNHTEMIKRAIQAQLDKVLKHKDVLLRAENQDSPEIPTWCSLAGKAIRGAISVYQIAQQDMLTPPFFRYRWRGCPRYHLMKG